jgi:hypothetical protein
MPQASITINATTGSNPPNGTALVIGSTVQLDNTNIGGEITYLWEWLDKPEGSLSAFSNPNIQNPTFVIDSEGTYLIKLTVNRTLATEQVDTVIAAIKQLKSKIRIPAAGETQEESTARGWAEDVNRAFGVLDTNQANPARLVAYANGALSTGSVVKFDSMQTIKSTLPGEEKVPRLALVQATSTDVNSQPLFVVHSKVGGGTSVSSGDLCYVTIAGIIGPLALSGGSAGDPVYVTDAGAVDNAAGTNTRRIGHIVYVSSGDYYIMVDGSLPVGEMSPLLLGGGVQLAESATALEVTAPGGVLFNTGAADVWEIKATGELAGVGTPRYIQNVKTPSGVSDATPKAYVDGVAGSAFVWGNSSTPGTTTQVVLDPGYEDRVAPAAAAAHPELRMPFTGVITNLYIQCGTGADATVDVTVYVGASPTSITVAMSAGATQGADTTHTAAVTAGDKVTIQCKGAGGITTGFVDVVATVFVKRA